MVDERMDAVLFGGKPCTLLGPQLKAGDLAPESELLDMNLAKKRLGDLKAKVKIISCVVSLDTGVCATETKKFIEEVGKLGSDVMLITVSRDLPFAQQRFCGSETPANAVFLSDYRDGSFGQSWGTLIKEVGLTCRAVFVVDAHNKIVHAQYVFNTPTEPDYAPVMEAVRAALGK